MKNKSVTPKKWARRLLIAAAAALLLVLLLLGAAMLWTDALVDILWFDALGYGLYYWMRLLYRYAVFVVVALVFFLMFFLNFWVAARFLRAEPATAEASDTTGEPKGHRRLISAFQTGTIWFYGPLSLALSIPVALPLFLEWERFLFYIFGGGMGLADPFLGKDAAFYLFSYPIYRLLQRRLLIALLILTAGLLVLYVAKNRVLKRKLLDFRRGARWHLSLLVLALFGLGVWEFMLQRYDLLYVTRHSELFFGPGYVEMQVVLPLIWTCAGLMALMAVMLVALVQGVKCYKSGIAVIVLLAAALALRYTTALPDMVQTYVVQPNEVEKERPYIAGHVQATLDAYKLTDLEVRDFAYRRFPSGGEAPQVEKVLRNIPVWDAETLVEVFQQLQELRTYYTFPRVSVGRYPVNGSRQQVFLGPREIEFDKLPGQARNWINAHLTYTHGYGAVMTPASQVSGGAMTWYLYDIPPKSAYGLETEQPRIYYGMGQYTYSIVPNRAGEMDYPQGERNVMTDYAGKGGVPISSLLRKFLFSYHLGNKNIFFSTKITDRSRLLFRRNILERIRHLTPFLHLDGTPYTAITRKGIFFIADAYTTSRYYPAAAPQRLGEQTFNYMRNSIKIVVDAYHGSVDFYLSDPDDPIARAYARIYPGLIKPLAALPEALQAHLRYPKDFFGVQMQIYTKYHQKDPQVFYQQEDLWTFPTALENENTVPLRPYYVTLDLIAPGRMDFMLLLPMFPKNRDNLRAMAIAGCDPESYGKLVIYNFPKGELVYGPAQIDALINQDPDIAEQFTLWDQAGSQIVRGKMIILPVDQRVLFIQPVYLKATSRVRIPELQRIIMSEGSVVVMEKSVQLAYAELQKRVAEGLRESREVRGDEPAVERKKPTEGPPPQAGHPTEGKTAGSSAAETAPDDDRPPPPESPVPADQTPDPARPDPGVPEDG